MPYLTRSISADVVQQLEQAVTLALTPSPSLSALAKALVRNSIEELSAAQQLRDIVVGKGVPAGGDTAEAVHMLSEAMAAAQKFPRLAGVLRVGFACCLCQNALIWVGVQVWLGLRVSPVVTWMAGEVVP